MDISENYGFYLPSRDGDDIADINQISENFKKIDTELSEMIKGKGVDQQYNPLSPNPQSGTAVSDAVKNLLSVEDETEWVFDGGSASGGISIEYPVDDDVDGDSSNAVSNKAIKKYVDGRTADYVVEQGSDGIWTYRKWESGLAECFGVLNTSVASTQAWGGTHYYGKLESVLFPASLFTEVPAVLVSISDENGNFFVTNRGATSDTVGELFAVSVVKVEQETTARLSIEAKGRWK